MNIDSIYDILEGYRAEDLYQAYRMVVSKYKIISVGTALGISVSMLIFFSLYIDAVQAALGFENKGGKLRKVGSPKPAALLGIFKPLLFIVLIVVAYPHVLNLIEGFLVKISSSLGGEVAPDFNLRDVWRKEALLYEKMMAQTSNWDVAQKIFLTLNYWGILIFKPFIILIEQDIYSLFLSLRYLYLAILELFGGVALACYLYEDTKQFTYTWLKHMLFCYLLITVLGMANTLAEEVFIVTTTNTGVLSYNILGLTFLVVVKLFLFRQSFTLLLNKVF